VLEAHRPDRYVFQWQHDLGGTTVEIDFEKHEDGTALRLREHGYPDTPESMPGVHELCDQLGRVADAAQVLGRARGAVLGGKRERA